MAATSNVAPLNVRQLGAHDVDRVIAIDRAHSGHARQRFFEKRFAAARARPDDFIQVGTMWGGALRGFAITSVLRGEFGHERPIAVLDAIGVEAQSQEHGIGEALLHELREQMRKRGVKSLHSQADWTRNDLLRFFANSGFRLAPRLAVERSVSEPLAEPSEEI